MWVYDFSIHDLHHKIPTLITIFLPPSFTTTPNTRFLILFSKFYLTLYKNFLKLLKFVILGNFTSPLYTNSSLILSHLQFKNLEICEKHSLLPKKGTHFPTHHSFQITILPDVVSRLSFLVKQMPFSSLSMLILFHSNVLMTHFLIFFRTICCKRTSCQIQFSIHRCVYTWLKLVKKMAKSNPSSNMVLPNTVLIVHDWK
jgi:hypothetical protein